ncbi:MAG: carboxylesterase [Pseudomonadota bacterium]|nr:carboxylesterase [Pseudomonadota bacterium]
MHLHLPQPTDFAWMSQGQHLRFCSMEDSLLLKPYEKEHRPQKKRALLMLHGFSSSPAVWRLFFPHLGSYDFIRAPLLAGHGISISEFANTSQQQWLHHVRIECKKLCQEYSEVDIIGLSLGGLLACHLVKEFPIKQLFLLAPALALKNNGPLLLKTAKVSKNLGFQFIKNAGGRAFLPQADELLFRLLPIKTIIEILSFIESFQFKSWDTPTQVYLGRHDDVINSSQVERQLKNLTEVDIHYLEKSNHVLPLDANYQDILQGLVSK